MAKRKPRDTIYAFYCERNPEVTEKRRKAHTIATAKNALALPSSVRVRPVIYNESQHLPLFTHAARYVASRTNFLGAYFYNNESLPKSITEEQLDALFGQGHYIVHHTLTYGSGHVPDANVKEWFAKLWCDEMEARLPRPRVKKEPGAKRRARGKRRLVDAEKSARQMAGAISRFNPAPIQRAMRQLRKDAGDVEELVEQFEHKWVVDVVRALIPNEGRLPPASWYRAAEVVGCIRPRNRKEEGRQNRIFFRLLYLTQLSMMESLSAYGAILYFADEGNIAPRWVYRDFNRMNAADGNHLLVLGLSDKFNPLSKNHRAAEDKEPVEKD